MRTIERPKRIVGKLTRAQLDHIDAVRMQLSRLGAHAERMAVALEKVLADVDCLHGTIDDITDVPRKLIQSENRLQYTWELLERARAEIKILKRRPRTLKARAKKV